MLGKAVVDVAAAAADDAVSETDALDIAVAGESLLDQRFHSCEQRNAAVDRSVAAVVVVVVYNFAVRFSFAARANVAPVA